MMSPDPTARPAPRSSRPKLASKPTIAACPVPACPVPACPVPARSALACPVLACLGTGGDVREVLADELEVVTLLHHGAEGVAGDHRVQVRFAEEVQGPGPVDRLRDP